MDGYCLGKHVFPNTAHLYTEWRKKSTSVDKAAAFKHYWVVAFVHDQHSNQSFIAIHNEVTSKLMHVFLLTDELLLVEAGEVAKLGADHNWDVS